MNDDKLIDAARRLGARAAERLDVDATARRVVERLREPVRRTVWSRQAWLRIAAALVLVVGGGVALRQLWPTATPPDHDTHLIADDLRDLSADELRAVLASFDQIITESVVPDSSSGLEELDAQQLRQLLREG
jgi:hypothetical protein